MGAQPSGSYGTVTFDESAYLARRRGENLDLPLSDLQRDPNSLHDLNQFKKYHHVSIPVPEKLLRPESAPAHRVSTYAHDHGKSGVTQKVTAAKEGPYGAAAGVEGYGGAAATVAAARVVYAGRPRADASYPVHRPFYAPAPTAPVVYNGGDDAYGGAPSYEQLATKWALAPGAPQPQQRGGGGGGYAPPTGDGPRYGVVYEPRIVELPGQRDAAVGPSKPASSLREASSNTPSVKTRDAATGAAAAAASRDAATAMPPPPRVRDAAAGTAAPATREGGVQTAPAQRYLVSFEAPQAVPQQAQPPQAYAPPPQYQPQFQQQPYQQQPQAAFYQPLSARATYAPSLPPPVLYQALPGYPGQGAVPGSVVAAAMAAPPPRAYRPQSAPVHGRVGTGYGQAVTVAPVAPSPMAAFRAAAAGWGSEYKTRYVAQAEREASGGSACYRDVGFRFGPAFGGLRNEAAHIM